MMKLSGKMSEKDAANIVRRAEIVNQHKLPRVWILLADTSAAKVYKKSGHGLELIANLHPSGSNGLHDKPEPYTHDNHTEGKAFASEIGLWLDDSLKSDDYDRLVLIAAPRMLGHLRHAISREVQDHIEMEINKDLTKMPDHKLEEELFRLHDQ